MERAQPAPNKMKVITGLFTGAVLTLASHNFAADASKPLSTDKEKASYGVGMNVGKRFKPEAIDIDLEAFIRGIRDSISGAQPAVPEAEVEKALEVLRKEMTEKATQQSAKYKKEGEEFLAKNKGEKSVTTLPSGLQYIVLKEGTGPMPKATDTVRVHYRGTLLDGTEFDSSYKRNEPAEFPVGGVIKGWVEALQKMKVGSKWKLFIPSDLAYGENGNGQIPPNATLVFEVELLEIKA
jgi:FKBP-type peptidyl-prolyl cis-trans isomerase